METSLPLGLYMKLCKVMAQINRLPKTGYNKAQNYAFASESDLTDMIRPLLANEGVFLFSSMDAVEQSPIESKNGAIGTHATVTMTFTFIDAETGELRASTWTGEAMDYQDKSINKAATAALKYFLLKTFLISTGESDDDADNATPEPGKRISQTETFQRTPPPQIPQRPTAGDDAKQTAINAMNKIGLEVYGDDWPAQRQAMIQEATKSSSVPLDKLMLPTIQAITEKVKVEKEALSNTPPAQPAGKPEAA